MRKPGFKVALVTAILMVCASDRSWSQDSQLPSSSEQKTEEALAGEDAEKLDRFLTKLALDSMPVPYVEDKDWGKQSERWDGLKVSFQNGRLRTKRRKKKVNHGTWDRYEVSLVDPDKNFSVNLDNLKEMDEGRVSFTVRATAKVSVMARQSKWVKGVQLYSISADGSADVQLELSVVLGSSMDVSKFPPDLIFDPKVEGADISVENFRIDRVSKAGGEFAQQVTRVVQKKIDKKIVEKEDKLVKKLNDKIEKNRDRFTLSVHDAMKSKWAAAAQRLVGKQDDSDE